LFLLYELSIMVSAKVEREKLEEEKRLAKLGGTTTED
jgi:sec-independent protein translocase protein TatC